MKDIKLTGYNELNIPKLNISVVRGQVFACPEQMANSLLASGNFELVAERSEIIKQNIKILNKTNKIIKEKNESEEITND